MKRRKSVDTVTQACGGKITRTEVNDLERLHHAIRALCIKEESRTACMALMVVLAEVVGASFDGPVESILDQLRKLIAEAQADYAAIDSGVPQGDA